MSFSWDNWIQGGCMSCVILKGFQFGLGSPRRLSLEGYSLMSVLREGSRDEQGFDLVFSGKDAAIVTCGCSPMGSYNAPRGRFYRQVITIREKKSRSDWIWGDYGESPHVFGFVHQMDENDDAVNQPNQIKGKNKLVHDLKQF